MEKSDESFEGMHFLSLAETLRNRVEEHNAYLELKKQFEHSYIWNRIKKDMEVCANDGLKYMLIDRYQVEAIKEFDYKSFIESTGLRFLFTSDVRLGGVITWYDEIWMDWNKSDGSFGVREDEVPPMIGGCEWMTVIK